MFEPTTTGLDLSRLENVRQRGNRIEARCPACREEGSDKSGDHLFVKPNGKFGCAARPGDHEHRQRIWRLAGGEIANPGPVVPTPKAEPALERHEWPELQRGSPEDLRRLSELRGIGIEGLALATERGILKFFTDRVNARCWTVSDDARHVRQDRRLDGRPFVLRDGRTAKSRTLGRPSWPVGTAAIRGRAIALFCEGGPDLLAACHLVATEGRAEDTAAVAMLGRGPRIHPAALARFAGKRLRFFVHNDQPGREGVARWWKDLDGVAGRIDAFQFSNLQQEDGSPVGDLNDFLSVDVDTWEAITAVRNPLPNDN